MLVVVDGDVVGGPPTGAVEAAAAHLAPDPLAALAQPQVDGLAGWAPDDDRHVLAGVNTRRRRDGHGGRGGHEQRREDGDPGRRTVAGAVARDGEEGVVVLRDVTGPERAVGGEDGLPSAGVGGVAAP